MPPDDEPLLGTPSWLTSAADLLAEPDPGPTAWLVENLIVDQSLAAAVGLWKTTKTLALEHISMCIVSGRSAFGALQIPAPGPVVYVIEESGRKALWRRLDALCRGHGMQREQLADLYVATNERVKLDDADWQHRLVELGQQVRPRLFVFDPLARMKAPGRDENDQGSMAVVIEYLRQLREETGAAVLFVHHQGKVGGTMRGSSDLESAWESRLSWRRDGNVVDLEAEHREAETSPTLRYRLSWSSETRSLRLVASEGLATLTDRIVAHLREHRDQTADQVAKALETRASDVRRTLRGLAEAGTTHNGPSGRRDAMGRAIHDKVWNLSSQAPLWPVPDDGTSQDVPPATRCDSCGPSPLLKEGDGTSHRTGHPEEADEDVSL
jgi:hypothetical protein